MRFEWDQRKNEWNMKKHHISFATAALVFNDDYRIEWYDKAHSAEEDRYITIGAVGEVLFVVYTERKDAVRLISARYATREERSVYYDSINNN